MPHADQAPKGPTLRDRELYFEHAGKQGYLAKFCEDYNIINSWRLLEPSRCLPLAVLTKPRVGLQTRIVERMITRNGKLRRAFTLSKLDKADLWVYLSRMGIDDGLVFMQYDTGDEASRGRLPHFAIRHPFHDQEPAFSSRHSLETRQLVY